MNERQGMRCHVGRRETERESCSTVLVSLPLSSYSASKSLGENGIQSVVLEEIEKEIGRERE